MKKLELKSVMDLLGAAAVLLGLVFVGFELRHNTAAVEAANRQSVNDGGVEWLLTIGTDADLAHLWAIGSQNPEEPTETESVQLHYLQRSQWVRFETAYMQWKNAMLSDDDWSTYATIICRADARTESDTSAANNRISTWDNHKGSLNSQFVEFVDSCRDGLIKDTE